MRSVLILLMSAVSALAAGAPEFEVANQLYDQGRFAEAKSAYEALAASDRPSANVFYNLGNANHRLGSPGEAMLGYERALALDPAHPEARANLDLLRGQTGAVVWPGSWLDRVFPDLWVDAYVAIGCLAGWGAVFLLAAIFTSPQRDKSAAWFWTVILAAVAGYSGAAVWHHEQERSLAVVTGKTAEVHLAPAESAAAAAALPAGSEVRVISERGDWIYCALPRQGRGWIPARTLARVRVGSS